MGATMDLQEKKVQPPGSLGMCCSDLPPEESAAGT